MSSAIKLTGADFDKAIKESTKPILVDFWASWCGPCRGLAPIIEEIATEEGARLRVGKLNIDENPEIAQRYRVMSIPTLILFKDGKPVVTSVGAAPKADILNKVKPHLS